MIVKNKKVIEALDNLQGFSNEKRDYCMMIKKECVRFFLFFLFVAQTIFCVQELDHAKIVVIDEALVFHNKRWKKPREAFVFLVKHQREFPMLLRVALVLAYKKLRGQKLSVGIVLKEFRELQKYKDEIYNFITLEEPDEELIEVLKKLKLQGIKLVFTTSMMKESCDYNKQIHKDIFDLFDDVLFVSGIKMHKLQKEYYHELRSMINEKYKPSDAPELILIDTNVSAAQQPEIKMQGLLFSSVEALEKDCVEKFTLPVKGSL